MNCSITREPGVTYKLVQELAIIRGDHKCWDYKYQLPLIVESPYYANDKYTLVPLWKYKNTDATHMQAYHDLNLLRYKIGQGTIFTCKTLDYRLAHYLLEGPNKCIKMCRALIDGCNKKASQLPGNDTLSLYCANYMRQKISLKYNL
jgi:hypothetical protein